MFVSETIASLPWTLHCGMPSGTLYIPSQTTIYNEETSSCVQHSEALYHSRRSHTRTKTTTATSTDYHQWKRGMGSRENPGQSLVQKEVPVSGEIEGI